MYKKQDNIKKIIKELQNNHINYDILNIMNDQIQHIRIDGFGDCWPSTGTWVDSNGECHKNDTEGFLNAIPKKDKENSFIGRVKELEDYCSFLENEIDEIKRHLALYNKLQAGYNKTK